MAEVQAGIREAVLEWCRKEGVVAPDPLRVEVAPAARIEFGDYTTNVAFGLAKVARMAPLAIAEGLAPHIAHRLPMVERVQAAAPGYLNLTLDLWPWLMGSDLPTFRATTDKVVVEHTSVNPNKAMHVGHLRSAVVGDTLARVLRRVGSPVEVHNYVDDLGKQVADTLIGLMHLPFQQTVPVHRFDDFCWDLYAEVTRLLDDPAWKDRERETLMALEQGDNSTAWLGALMTDRLLREQLDDMQRFNIRYDLLVHESDIVREGFWALAFKELERSPRVVCEESGRLEGCWVLRTGDDEAASEAAPEADPRFNPDKVLVRSNGTLTYVAKDIAYHLWKFGRLAGDFKYRPGRGDEPWSTDRAGGANTPGFGHASRVVNVIDRRQDYAQAMVRLALSILGHDDAAENLWHVSYGVVSLSPSTAAGLGVDVSAGRSSYPMAGRKGIGIKVSELLALVEAAVEEGRSRTGGLSSAEVAAGAIRYYLLRHNLQTEIVFDVDAARDMHGNTGPYLMYAHARAASVLRRVEGPTPAAERRELSPVERALALQLREWPVVLLEAAGSMNPTVVATYAYRLADAFTRFYETHPVARAEASDRPLRVLLTRRCRAVLGDALDVLGLPAPEEM
jgi:arginyl-tRNA synthetase